MTFTPIHTNRNVRDLEKSVAFYEQALGFEETRRRDASDGSFTLVFLKAPGSDFLLELTWLRDMDRAYDLGDNEIHLAIGTDDFAGALAKHREMGCVCQDSNGRFYFIADPDGYWIEIIKAGD